MQSAKIKKRPEPSISNRATNPTGTVPAQPESGSGVPRGEEPGTCGLRSLPPAWPQRPRLPPGSRAEHSGGGATPRKSPQDPRAGRAQPGTARDSRQAPTGSPSPSPSRTPGSPAPPGCPSPCPLPAPAGGLTGGGGLQQRGSPQQAVVALHLPRRGAPRRGAGRGRRRGRGQGHAPRQGSAAGRAPPPPPPRARTRAAAAAAAEAGLGNGGAASARPVPAPPLPVPG